MLSLVESPRAQALGGATTALGIDATLVWQNPAAAAHVRQPSLTLGGQRSFLGGLTWQALGVLPLGGRNVYSLGLSYYDAGSLTLRMLDGTSRRVNAQQDWMGSLGVGVALSSVASWGVLVKALRSELLDEFTATAAAFDTGVQVRLNKAFKLGVMMQNVGSKLKYRQDKISLPTAWRAGLAYGYRVGTRDLLIGMADTVYALQEGALAVRGGVEYQWRGMVAVRAGAQLSEEQQVGNYSAGLGLTVQQYRLDYAIQLDTTFDLPQLFSLTISF